MLRPCRASSALMSFPMCGSSVIGLPLRGALRRGQTKWAEPSVCLLETEGPAKPVKRNKQQIAYALGREPFATYSLFTSNLPIISLQNKSVKLGVVSIPILSITYNSS